MSVQAIVTLDTLRCIQESDRGNSEHSEPYVWPFMAAITNSSFATTPTAAILSETRKIIRNEMRPGQSAALGFPGNRLTATFDDSQTVRHLILIVGLWEADDAPLGAIQAGYQAFLDELKLRIGHNALALAGATPSEQQVIIDAIKRQVSARVRGAIEGHLSAWETFRIGVGAMNMDDFVATGVRHFAEVAPQDFTLEFAGVSGDPKLVPVFAGTTWTWRAQEFPMRFAIDGTLAVQEISVHPRQAAIDAVLDAEGAVTGLRRIVRALQEQLAHATPQQKAGIVAQIEAIQQERIPAAEITLERARRALRLSEVRGVVTPVERVLA